MRKTVLLFFVPMCLLLLPTSSAVAYLVDVYTVADPIQDDWVVDGLVDELGNQPPFPDDEWITSEEVTWEGHVPCPSEYWGTGAVQVRITNNTGKVWRSLYYVADPETSLTNYDEWVGSVHQEMAPESLGITGAFKIDWVGENTPLVYESMTQDGIFEIGETWEFVIQDYSNTLGLSPAAFGSLGVSNASGGDQVSSGSIIPEPATIFLLLGLGGLALLKRR